MNEQKHTIGRQVLELTVTDREQALHIQNDTSMLVKSKLIPALDKLFNNLTTPDEVLRIDRLVLDLGDITESSFDEELVSMAIKELEHQLTEAIHTQKTKQATPSVPSANDDDRVVFLSKPESHLEQFVHYLKYGVLPWWRETGVQKKTGLNELLQAVGKENRESLAEVILPLIKTEQVRLRIAYQLTTRQFFELVTFFPKIVDGEAEKNIRQLASGKLAKQWEVATSLRFHLLSMIGEGKELRTANSFEKLTYRIILDGLSGDLPVNEKVFLAAFITHLDAIALTPGSKEKIYRFIIQTAKEKNIPLKAKELKTIAKSLKQPDKGFAKGKEDEQSKSPTEEAEETGTDTIVRNQETTDTTTAEPGDRKTTGSEDEEDTDSTGKKESAFFDKKENLKSGVPEEDLESADSSFATAETSKEPDQKKFRLAVDQQEVWVNNAGIVLLNPFLFFFFDGLGLLDKEKNFKSDQHAFRAVHLLQYLATGDSASPEHELSLNKILCGIDLNDPIPYDLRLTKKEKEECDHLISVVLERWEVLKTKDPEALRNGFLRREGRLSFQGSGWNLFIERTTLDVLLARLPWSLSMIKLPWRDDIIYVEW